MIKIITKCMSICFFQRQPAPLLVAAALLVIPTSLRGSEPITSGRYATELPLAVRVYKVLQLPRGSHPWLSDLAKLIAVLPPTRTWSQPHASSLTWAAFKRALPDAHAVVRALNSGADPTALRRKLLAALNIDGRYTPPKGKKWLYGSLLQRMELVNLFMREGIYRVVLDHNNNSGKRYLRAALLLSSQEDVQVPWDSILNGWVHTNLVPDDSSWTLEMRNSHRRFLDMFAGLAQQQQLDGLYRTALRWNTGPFIKNYNAFSDINMKAVKMAKDGSAVTNALLQHLRMAIADAPNIHWRYEILRSALAVRRELNLEDQRNTAKAVGAILAVWGRKIKENRSMPKLERNTLLRWIKEASF